MQQSTPVCMCLGPCACPATLPCWVGAFSVVHNWEGFVKILTWILHVLHLEMYSGWKACSFEGVLVLFVFTHSDPLHFLQCIRAPTSAIWTCFLIFFVASPSSLYCFVLLFLCSLDDFFLNYLEQLLLLQTWFTPLKNSYSSGCSDRRSLWPPQLSWEFLPCCRWISQIRSWRLLGVFCCCFQSTLNFNYSPNDTIILFWLRMY